MSRVLDIDNLPPPPANQYGWPWTEAVQPSLALLEGQERWPTISVITPSLNQGRFIERTLRSVLLQGYPALEYIVMDGGSTDQTRAVLDRYQPFLTHVESEPDRGQAHGINKGFARATGDILCWINSDDYYLPGALFRAARYFKDPAVAVTCGNALQEFDDGRRRGGYVRGKFWSRKRFLKFWKSYDLPQPAMFWRRDVYETVGPLKEDYHYIFDFDYWARVTEKFPITVCDDLIAAVTYHSGAKTGDGYRNYSRELSKHARDYWGPSCRREYWGLLFSRATWPVLGRIRGLKRSFRRSSAL